jgi:hypothetical protein
MKKQVPEERDPIGSLKQIEQLLERLAGHQVFGRRRGTLNYFAFKIAEMVEEAETPSQFLKIWDEFSGDMRVLGNMLAQEHRDGNFAACNALVEALANSNYRFPGEAIPVQKTSPLTLVMFEPHKTFAMLNWIMQGRRSDIRRYITEGHKGFQYDPHPTDSPAQIQYGQEYWRLQYQRVAKMFRAYTTLEKVFSSGLSRLYTPVFYPGWELLYSYGAEVLQKYRIGYPNENPELLGLQIRWGQYDEDLEPKPQSHSIYTIDEVEVECTGYFVFLFKGDQAGFLERFDRKQQKKIATWQFHVAPDALEDMRNWKVGMHPEPEHAAFQKLNPRMVSASVSKGWGALLEPSGDYEAFYKGSKLDPSGYSRFVFEAS